MLENILKIFSEYGYPGIVVLILLGVLVYLFKKQESGLGKSFEKMTTTMSDSIANQNTQLVGILQESQNKLLDNQMNMFNYMLESNKDKDKVIHDTALETRKQMLVKINGILRRICEDSDCSRVTLIEFHNSKENLNGLPFLWYDIHAEYFRRGKMPIMSKVKDLQAFNLICVIESVNDSEKGYSVYDKEALAKLEVEAPTLYNQIVQLLEVELIVYIGLYNEDNLLVGLLTMEYDDESTWKEFIDEKNETIILEKARTIEHLLKKEPKE